jgi:hypothetical protein
MHDESWGCRRYHTRYTEIGMSVRINIKRQLEGVPLEEITEDEWREIEDKFRYYAFSIYYHKTYRDELDLTLRFANALVSSCAPILDKQGALDWYLHKRRTTKKK